MLPRNALDWFHINFLRYFEQRIESERQSKQIANCIATVTRSGQKSSKFVYVYTAFDESHTHLLVINNARHKDDWRQCWTRSVIRQQNFLFESLRSPNDSKYVKMQVPKVVLIALWRRIQLFSAQILTENWVSEGSMRPFSRWKKENISNWLGKQWPPLLIR